MLLSLQQRLCSLHSLMQIRNLCLKSTNLQYAVSCREGQCERGTQEGHSKLHVAHCNAKT
jgi:hypothetical protein